MQSILIAVVDGLKGFPEAINTVLPETTVQTCIVHLIRNSLDFAYVFAPDIRKIIYTANSVESLHMQLRKTRSHFPSDEATLELIWLALRNVVAKWTGSRHDWKSAMTQFALLYPERLNIGL